LHFFILISLYIYILDDFFNKIKAKLYLTGFSLWLRNTPDYDNIEITLYKFYIHFEGVLL